MLIFNEVICNDLRAESGGSESGGKDQLKFELVCQSSDRRMPVICIGPVCVPMNLLLPFIIGILHSYGTGLS